MRYCHKSNTGQCEAGFLREQVIQANFLAWLSMRMPPKKLVDRAAGLPAKPGSILDALLTVRRIHDRMTLPMVPLKLALQVLKGVTRDFRDDLGITYARHLLKQKKEPFTNETLGRLISLVDSSSAEDNRRLGRKAVLSALPFWVTLSATIHVMAQAGFRKNEIAVKSHTKDPWGSHKPCRANVTWHLQEAPRPVAELSPEQYRRLRPGDFAILQPPASKADQFGVVWGCKPIFLPFSSTDHICAARALAKLELAVPCRGALDRESTPLFSNTDTGKAWTYGELDRLLSQLLQQVLPDPNLVSQYSWH